MTYPYDPASGSNQQPWGEPQYPPAQPSYGPQPQPQYEPFQPQTQPPAAYGGGYPSSEAGFAPFPQPSTPPKRTRRLAASIAAVVVIGGGAATYVAVSSTSASGGAGSPKAAVQTLMNDLGNSDLAGVLDDLPPGERASIAQPLERTIALLKKNDVIRSDANLSKVSGLLASVTGLTYANDTIPINDHVQIVQLTAGKITFSADAAKLPITQDFLRAVAPHGTPAPSSQTIDIAKIVSESGRPLRIATQESGGRWYPSLLYTAADNIVVENGLTAPSAADRIPANGASSPDEAVRGFIDALLAGNVEGAAELLSPDELAVIHDYGKLIVDRVHYSKPNVTIKDLQFTDTTYSGGVRVQLKSIDIMTSDSEVKLAISGNCIDVSGQQGGSAQGGSAQGGSKHLCAADILSGLLSAGSEGPHFTAGQQKAISDVFSGLGKLAGLDATQSGGSWYLSPVQSIFDVVNTLLSALQGDDMKELLSLAGH